MTKHRAVHAIEADLERTCIGLDPMRRLVLMERRCRVRQTQGSHGQMQTSTVAMVVENRGVQWLRVIDPLRV